MNLRWAKRVLGAGELGRAWDEGFDAARLPVASIMSNSPRDFPAERDRLLAIGFPLAVFESPLPTDARVTERGFNYYCSAN